MKLHLSLLIVPLTLSLAARAELRLDLVNSTTLDYAVHHINWCQGCDFLGVAGQQISPQGTLQPFLLDQMTNILAPAGTEGTLGTELSSVSWRNDCKYAVFGGINGSTGIVEVYGFNPGNPGSFQPTNTVIEYYQAVSALDWCQSSSIIAISGYTFDGVGGYFNYIQLYNFDDTTNLLTPVSNQIQQEGYFSEMSWCNNCQYLAGAGRYFSIFTHNLETNTLTSIYNENIQTINSLDWCPSCSYIAVGGYNANNQGFFSIYQFNPEDVTPITNLFTIYIPAIFPPQVPSAVTSVRWCGCDYLVVTATIDTDSLLMLYRFSPTLGISLVQAVNPNMISNNIAWCNNCDYLAVGGGILPGKNGLTYGLIDLYETITC